jgi:hypothetical protein
MFSTTKQCGGINTCAVNLLLVLPSHFAYPAHQTAAMVGFGKPTAAKVAGNLWNSPSRYNSILSVNSL